MSSSITFATWVQGLVSIINSYVIPLLYALAFVYLMIGLVRYFFIQGSSEEGREKGKQTVIYGLIGMFVLFAVWGIVNLLLSLLTLNVSESSGLPTNNTQTPSQQVPGTASTPPINTQSQVVPAVSPNAAPQ